MTITGMTRFVQQNYKVQNSHLTHKLPNGSLPPKEHVNPYCPEGMDITGRTDFRRIVPVDEGVANKIKSLVFESMEKNCGMSDGEIESEIIRNYVMSLPPEERAAAGWIEKAGGRGIGLGGMDGGLFQAKRLTDRAGTDYGYVGDIVDVDPAPVIDVLQQGYIPVVSTVAQGIDDETNYNINADTAASKLAVALGAKKLILLTDVRGLMLDVNDENSVLHRLKVSEVPKLVRDGVIKGGMIPKVDCCVEAVRKGVERATILDGRVKHSILIELLSDVGAGTMFQ